jgi:hypothetical protein
VRLRRIKKDPLGLKVDVIFDVILAKNSITTHKNKPFPLVVTTALFMHRASCSHVKTHSRKIRRIKTLIPTPGIQQHLPAI